MAEAASIVLKTYDELNDTIKSIQGNSRALDKEFEVLQNRIQLLVKKNDTFNKSFAETSTQVVAAKKALKEMEAAFKANGDEQSRLNLSNAKKQYKDLTDAAEAYKAASRSTRKEISNSQEQMRKLGNESGGSAGGLFKGQLAADLGKMVGSSVQGYANYLFTSAAGSQTGTLLSSILGGAISGGAMGSIGGIGPGTAIGAVVGGVSGLIQGVTANESSKDDAFKSYVQDAYNTVTQQQTDSLTNGSTIAGSREQTQIVFAKRLGSDQAATAYLDKVQEMAQNTNYSYDEITGYSQKLLNSYKPDEILGVLKNLSDASAGLDLNSSDMDMFVSGLSKMRTTGKVTQEYLGYFSDRGVDVDQALSDATGTPKSGIADRVSKGEISGDAAAQAILDYINKTFGGMSDKLASTYDALTDNLQDVQDNINSAKGDSYNKIQEDSLSKEIELLGGALGDKLKSVNAAIGSAEGSKANIKRQISNDVMGGILEGTAAKTITNQNTLDKVNELRNNYLSAWAKSQSSDEQVSMEGGAELESIMAQAEALVSSEQDTNDNLSIWHQTEQDTASGVNSIVALLKAWENTWNLNQTQSEGRNIETTDETIMGDWSTAFGLSYVPYDNYPALLHQGEKVLTAEQARRKGGGGARVTITGNSFVVRQNSDINAIAEALANKLERSALASVS